MALTDAGKVHLATTLIGAAVTAFNNANAYLGVGESTDAFDATETDLQGASKIRKGMEAGYPSRASNVLTFRSVFAAGEANFAWQEWGTMNASSADTMFNRKVESLGTKTSAQVWQLTITLTVNNP